MHFSRFLGIFLVGVLIADEPLPTEDLISKLDLEEIRDNAIAKAATQQLASKEQTPSQENTPREVVIDLPETELILQVKPGTKITVRKEEPKSPPKQETARASPKTVTSSEKKNSKQMSQGPTPQARMFEYRPSLDTHHWYVTADYLYWRLQNSQQDFAIANAPATSEIPSLFDQVTFQIGDIEECATHWRSGFRVGLGTVFTHDFWDIETYYTYLAPEGSDSKRAKNGKLLLPTIDAFDAVQTLSAKAHVSMKYNVLDLILAKRLQISKQILLRLNLGATGAWLKHHFKATFQPINSSGYTAITTRKWDFQGGGVKIGFSTDWFFGKGLSLVGLANLGLLYGDYQNTYFSGSFSIPSGNLAYVGQNNKMHNHRLVYTTQFLLGPSFGWKFLNWGFDFTAAYELNLWHNLQEVLYSTSNSSISGRESRYTSEPFGLQGLTLHAQFYF